MNNAKPQPNKKLTLYVMSQPDSPHLSVLDTREPVKVSLCNNTNPHSLFSLMWPSEDTGPFTSSKVNRLKPSESTATIS